MTKKLHSIDILKHATPVETAPKKRKSKKEEPVDSKEIPEVKLDVPPAKKPRTEKQIAATEKLKALNAEKKAAAAKALEDQIRETERLKIQSEKLLQEKKEARAIKRKEALDVKNAAKPPLPPISEEVKEYPKGYVHHLTKQQPPKQKKSKPLIIQDVIKEVHVKQPPTPVESPKAPLQSVSFNTRGPGSNIGSTVAPVFTARERKEYENWAKRGNSIFGGNYFGSSRRMR